MQIKDKNDSVIKPGFTVFEHKLNLLYRVESVSGKQASLELIAALKPNVNLFEANLPQNLTVYNKRKKLTAMLKEKNKNLVILGRDPISFDEMLSENIIDFEVSDSDILLAVEALSNR